VKQLPAAISRLSTELARLPGVGERSALRLAFFLLKAGTIRSEALAHSLLELHENVRFCDVCQHLSSAELCEICIDPSREHDLVCIVEGVPDLLAIERTGEFKGTYHVLHGVLSPLRGVGPEDLNLSALVERVDKAPPREVIIATPVSVEGEATASYICRLIGREDLLITRIASGVPQGAELEFIDQATLSRALRARSTL
jgi:recombination protein RecR